MSRFFVGQRVRLARPFFPAHEGITGTIVEFFPHVDDALGNQLNCRCEWDQTERLLPACRGGKVHTDRLEPLTDPGREVVSWADCVWKPQHLRSRVEA